MDWWLNMSDKAKSKYGNLPTGRLIQQKLESEISIRNLGWVKIKINEIKERLHPVYYKFVSDTEINCISALLFTDCGNHPDSVLVYNKKAPFDPLYKKSNAPVAAPVESADDSETLVLTLAEETLLLMKKTLTKTINRYKLTHKVITFTMSYNTKMQKHEGILILEKFGSLYEGEGE